LKQQKNRRGKINPQKGEGKFEQKEEREQKKMTSKNEIVVVTGKYLKLYYNYFFIFIFIFIILFVCLYSYLLYNPFKILKILKNMN
jgi:hypothetical protein